MSVAARQSLTPHEHGILAHAQGASLQLPRSAGESSHIHEGRAMLREDSGAHERQIQRTQQGARDSGMAGAGRSGTKAMDSNSGCYARGVRRGGRRVGGTRTPSGSARRWAHAHHIPRSAATPSTQADAERSHLLPPSSRAPGCVMRRHAPTATRTPSGYAPEEDDDAALGSALGAAAAEAFAAGLPPSRRPSMLDI